MSAASTVGIGMMDVVPRVIRMGAMVGISLIPRGDLPLTMRADEPAAFSHPCSS